MGGSLWGADPDDLRRLASVLERAGDGLEDGARLVGAKIRSSGWDGPDAQRYLARWQSSHQPMLLAVGRDLAATATALRREAKAQEQTSDGGGAGNPFAGWSGSGSAQAADQDMPTWIGYTATGLGGVGMAAEGLTRWVNGIGWVDDVAALGRWGKVVGGAGPVLDALGIVVGGYEAVDNGLDWLESGESADLYNAGDGYVTAALSTTALATAWIPGVNLVTGGIALGWGLADGLNDLFSDRPLTQNLIDYSPVGMLYDAFGGDGPLSEDLNDLAVDAKDAVVDTAQDVGGFLKDAGKGALGALGF